MIAAGIMAFSGVQLFQLPIGGVTVLPAPIMVALTVLAVVFFTNAVNFIDGLDGLAAGSWASRRRRSSSTATCISRTYDPPNVFSSATFISAALIGCCVGFLPHNFHPARLFMGDSGALLLGLLLAAATISTTGSVTPVPGERQPGGRDAAAAGRAGRDHPAAGRRRAAGRRPAHRVAASGRGSRTLSTCTTGCSRSATGTVARSCCCGCGRRWPRWGR